jgi:hypothetical protein
MDQPPLTRTSLQPDYHKNHNIRVDSSLIGFFELVLRLLVFDKKDQSPPPDRLKTFLIRVDLIMIFPIVFAQYVT